MKTIKDIIELYKPKSADEDRFVKKHVIKKTEDANGNKDDVFNATNVKPENRAPNHGYNPGEDEKVYEGYEEIRFDNPEDNSKPSRSPEPMRNRRKRIDDMMNKLGKQHGKENLASEIKQRYSAKNESVTEDSHSDHFKFLLPLQKAGVPAPSKERAMDLIAKHGDPLRAGKAYVDRYKKIKNAANKVQKEEIELDEARKPKMTPQRKMERLLQRYGFPTRHLPKDATDTGTTSSLEGNAKQNVAKRTMQNNSYELEGQQLNELGYQQNDSGRLRPGSPMDSAQIKRNSTLRRADAESPLKTSDIPIGKAPVRSIDASSGSPVTSPAPVGKASTRSIAASLGSPESGSSVTSSPAPALPLNPKIPLSPVRPPVAHGGRGGLSQNHAATAPAPKPVSAYKGTTASQDLAKLNKIKNVNNIRVGQTISLGGDKSYTVQKGDTLDKISKRNTAPSAPTGAAAPKSVDKEALVQTTRNAVAGTDADPIRSAAAIPSGENPRKAGGFGPGRGNHPVDFRGVTSGISNFLKRRPSSTTSNYVSGGINSSYEPEGDQFNELVLNPFLRGLLEATCKECGEKYKGKTCPCCMKEDVQIDELFGIGDTVGALGDAGRDKARQGAKFVNKTINAVKTKSATMDQQAAAERKSKEIGRQERNIGVVDTNPPKVASSVVQTTRNAVTPTKRVIVTPDYLRKAVEKELRDKPFQYKEAVPKSYREDVQLDEILEPSMGAAAYIKDFVDSKNPKFDGLSKEKRKQMALAAYYAAKKGK